MSVDNTSRARSADDALAPGSAAAGVFRRDIQGLRALAVGLVLAVHAGLPLVSGGFVGVDVFFVISGYLITAMLLRELRDTGTVGLAQFYARRFRRLLPAATLVILVTLGLLWMMGPPAQRRLFAADAIASAFSVVNWQFAARAVDYQAEGIGVSPFQHYWSLAVEEQFYVVWPLLIVVAVGLARVTRRTVKPLAVSLLVIVTISSLAYAVVATASSPTTAFFVSTTRLWEMGVGALVASASGIVGALAPWLARLLGWGGLLTILTSAVVFDASTPWPGAWALAPTLGTAAVILAGRTSQRYVPGVLTLPVAVWVGGLSYSLYLWHWPLLVAATWRWGELGLLEGVAVAVASLVPAWLSYRFVENPLRRSGRLKSSTSLTLSFGVNLVALAIVAALVLQLGDARGSQGSRTSDQVGATILDFDGESVSGVDKVPQPEEFWPTVSAARDDEPRFEDDGCNLLLFEEAVTVLSTDCVYGSPQPSTRVVVAGDSKAAQWFDAIAAVGERREWAVLPATKSSCAFASVSVRDVPGEEYTYCREYGDVLLEELLADPPAAVIVSQGSSSAIDADGEQSRDLMVDALAARWAELEAAGIDVVVLLDNPRPVDLPAGDGQVPDCVAEYASEPAKCEFSKDAGLEASASPVLLEAALRVPQVAVVDMTDVFCDATCPPVIGGVLVYRQGSHITNSYALSTVDILDARLAREISASG